jgi:signal transduction histidine kinase
MMLRIGLLCLCLLTLTAKAQYNPFHVPKNLPDRDSLKAIIQTTKDPIQKLDALRELGHAYYENKRDSALFFFEQGVATAKQINSKLWEADAFNSLGFVSYILGNYPRALQFLSQAKTIAEDPNSEKGEWRSNPSGFVSPTVARLSILARSYQHLATLYSYTRSASDTGSAELSLDLYRKALAISTSISDTPMMSVVNMNTSRHFSLENNLDSVIFYHNRALQLMNAAGYRRYIGNAMFIMGETYRKHQQPETAKIFYWYGMEQGKIIENTRSAADNSLALANLLLSQGNTDSAIFYGYNAVDLFRSTLILAGLADSYATLSSAFNAKKKIDSAFHYQGLSLSARKQLDAEDNSRRFQQLAFDEKLKEQESAERERLARNRIIMSILLGGLAVLAAIGIFLYRNNIARKKANQLLAQKNRELEIESSLDRVRTRAMALHKSEDLHELIATVYQELVKLDITLNRCFIMINHKGSGDTTWWMASQENPDIQRGYLVPYHKQPPYLAYLDAWQQSQEKLLYIFEGKEKEDWDKVLFEETELKQLPDFVQAGMRSVKKVYWYSSFNKFGCLGIGSLEPLSDQSFDILQRFSRVFEQTYTRFLDLQKAESQAREAQIEAALEKVRARSMAMHKSEELKEVIQLVYDQMLHLKIPVEHTGFIIDYKQRDDMHIWLADQNSTPVEVSFPYFDAPHWNSFIEAKKTGASFFANHHSFEEKNAFYTKLFDLLPGVLDEVRDFYFNCPGLDISTVLLGNIGLYIENFSGNPYTDEENAILMRFGRVFQQAYTRFIDLQKAEASAREAQIEAALERVRAKTMAMQKSDELQEAANLLFNQVQALGMPAWSAGYCTWHDDSKNSVTLWMSSEGVLQPPFVSPTTEDELFIQMRAGAEQGKELHIAEMGGEALRKHYEYMRKLPVVGQILDSIIAAGHPLPTFQIMHQAYFSKGFLLFITYEPVPAAHDIFIRFSRVFDQTYTRFLDLQKAEAQARESQIEAALERVRSRSLAMHHTNELQDVVNVAAQQLLKMDIDIDGGMFIAINEEVNDDLPFWAAAGAADYVQKVTLPFLDRPTFKGLHSAILRREPFYTEYYSTAEKNEFLEHMFGYDPWKQNSEERKQELRARTGGYTRSVAIGKYTSIGMTNHHGKIFSDAENEVLRRFGAVLEQSYTRFLDLRKAEEQAREAQIELGLERVRARAMAMQTSSELSELVDTVFKELTKLDFALGWCIINIIDESTMSNTVWAANPNIDLPPDSYHMLFEDYPFHDAMMIGWKERRTKDVYILEGEEKKVYDEYLFNETEFRRVPPEAQAASRAMEKYVVSFTFSNFGGLQTVGEVPLSEANIDILSRFGKVFDLTYTRFNDLQKAEAQAREARIEAALEKVRSRTLSMQKSDELAETAAVMFRQLIGLGIAPNRLYIIIIKEENGDMEAWLTDEDGSRVSIGFTGNLHRNQSLHKMYEAWKAQQKTLVIDMQGEELQSYFHYLHDDLKVPFKGGLEQKRRVQHVAFFSKGLIGIASPEPQPAETLLLLERFAAVFNLTFTRFNDLKIAEAHAIQAELDLMAIKEAKQKAEVALTELQATQKQLIQAEKMASLGELTAGIAHEIQNPLNFVNNFAEVNTEMIAEGLDALKSSSIEDAEEILSMLADNNSKILQHGKRADAIVKGMLQHTRSGSGTKEPTDINALCDEYLRLAFHGFRAKDKSFNSDFSFTPDPDLGKINAVPQEIGRVILNLISNAFYAVHEKAKSSGKDYHPAVKVMTRKTDGMVVIAVADNGTGIPQKVVDKIFQPFFTTKPTGEGTGLGLSLSYDIVKALGGELTVETKEGEGTAFVINLPAI